MGPSSKFIEETVPDSFLLHCGALLGEKSAETALQTIDRSKDLGTAQGLFGEAEDAGWVEKPWKKPTIKSKPGLTFKLEKKYMRKGLFLYRTSAGKEDPWGTTWSCSPLFVFSLKLRLTQLI